MKKIEVAVNGVNQCHLLKRQIIEIYSTRIRDSFRSRNHKTLYRAEADSCLVCGNLSGSVSDRRSFYLHDDEEDRGTDGETAGGGGETGTAHGSAFP